MASNLTKKIEEIEDSKLKSGELFMYGHCEDNGDINAGVDRGKDEAEVRDEAADLLTDTFEDFDFYGDFE